MCVNSETQSLYLGPSAMESQKCAFPVKKEGEAIWPQHQQSAAVLFQIFAAANFECPGLSQKEV